eukprot:m.36419 g.36419  ORF g.36419 m.36419 type:complete len:873 (-) comp17353_c0_seq3:305-2923(-)
MERNLLPSNVVPSAYKLRLEPDLVGFTFDGQQVVDIEIKEETDTITLHSVEIEISKVVVTTGDGAALAESPVITYDTKAETASFKFASSLKPCSCKLEIIFKGCLNDKMAGFYRSKCALGADGIQKYMAITQFEPTDARKAFPCWDEPAKKATFSITMRTPAGLESLGNMPVETTTPNDDGSADVTFGVTPIMSTYLVAFCVGEFEYIQKTTKQGVDVKVYTPHGLKHEGEFALSVAVATLDYFSEFFAQPYPLPKLDMIAIADFAAGAMENWGLVTYREVDMMIDEAKASSQQRQRVAIVVAHELAHQWFGNLVTMEWWNDLWLNEGFASFMENYCTDRLFKDDDWGIWEQYGVDTMGAAQRLDSLKSSHPIQVPIGRAEEVEQVFDAISYCKGSVAVRMVFCLLGEAKFQEGLQNYMGKYKYGNTVTTNLWDSWSEVYGRDVAKIMAGWTQQMGYPYIQVVEEKWGADSVELTLKQAWFLADGSADDSEVAKVWSIPLKFSNSSGVLEEVQIMSEPTQKFTIALGGVADSFVKINAGQFALARVAYSPTMTQRLQLGVTSLPPIDRAALITDAYALAKAGIGSVEDVVQLLKHYGSETNSSVWKAISGALSGLKKAMTEVGGEALASFNEFGAKLVKAGFLSVGWTEKPEDTHSDKLLRATLVGLLDAFCFKDEDVVAQARDLFDKHFDEPSVLPADIKTTVYRIVVKSGGDEEYERVLKTFYSTNDNSERKFAMYSLGVTTSMELKNRTLDWAVKSGDVKLQDFFYPISPTGGDAEGSVLVWNYFKENIAVYEDMLKNASPSLMNAVIVNSIGYFSTLERAEEIETYFNENPLPKSSRKIAQCVEAIRNNGQFLLKVKSSKLIEANFWA